MWGYGASLLGYEQPKAQPQDREEEVVIEIDVDVCPINEKVE